MDRSHHLNSVHCLSSPCHLIRHSPSPLRKGGLKPRSQSKYSQISTRGLWVTALRVCGKRRKQVKKTADFKRHPIVLGLHGVCFYKIASNYTEGLWVTKNKKWRKWTKQEVDSVHGLLGYTLGSCQRLSINREKSKPRGSASVLGDVHHPLCMKAAYKK